MPRLTPWRVITTLLKLILILYLLIVALYCVLPSPQISPTKRLTHIQNTLRSGQTLTTVHHDDGNFNSNSSPDDNCAFVILNWQLIPDPSLQEIFLEISGGSYHDSTRLRLQEVEIAGIGPTYQDALRKTAELYVGVGDRDHYFNLPWFDDADTALLHHDVHGFNYLVRLRTVIKPGTVEVWKDALFELDEEKLKRNRERGLLAKFSNIPTGAVTEKSIRQIKVDFMAGRLPTRTFALRKDLLVLVGPLPLILMVVGYIPYVLVIFFSTILRHALELFLAFSVFGLAIGTLYAGIVAACWFYQGQPEFRRWKRRFWLTRWLPSWRDNKEETVIWGAKGPIHGRASSTDDEEHQVGWRRGRINV